MSLKALPVDIVNVVEEEMVVLFVTHLPNYVENAKFTQIFLDKDLVCYVWVEVLLFFIVRRLEAVCTI